MSENGMMAPELETGVWNLRDLGCSDLPAAFDEYDRLIDEAKGMQENLDALTPEKFRILLNLHADICLKKEALLAFGALKFSEDVKDDSRVEQKQQIEKFLSDRNETFISFCTWFKKLPEETAQSYMSVSGYHVGCLNALREASPFAYPTAEEETKQSEFNETVKKPRIDQWKKITSYEYPFRGETLNRGELVAHVYSKDPEVRRDAYLTLSTPYAKDEALLFETYKFIVESWREEHVQGRGHSAPIGATNLSNRIDNPSIDALFEAYQRSLGMVGEYLELKRQALSLPVMRRFDMYAPVGGDLPSFTYESALGLTMDTLGELSPDFERAARAIIDARHVHSRQYQSKETGAYCWSPNIGTEPYVFVNFTGDMNDTFTLAHEFGHGVHGEVSRGVSQLCYEPPIALAEVASITTELFFRDKVLEQNPELETTILFAELDSIYATCFRQIGFSRFEVSAHDMIAKGATVNEVNDEYYRQLQEQFGPKVEIDPMFAREWQMIPHFIQSPFYCYAYGIGQIVALAVYQKIKQDGQPAEGYKRVLELGGSKRPQEALLEMGLDMSSPEFWKLGFKAIQDKIDRLKQLV